MKKFEKIVVATRNPSKVLYYKQVLTEIAAVVVGLDDLQKYQSTKELGFGILCIV